MTAKEAQQITVKAKEKNINYQRNFILDAIKVEAQNGYNQLVLNIPRIILSEDDYLFFELLGYKVTRPSSVKLIDSSGTTQMYNIEFGVISW